MKYIFTLKSHDFFHGIFYKVCSLLLILIMVIGFTACDKDTYESAVEAYRNGNYKEALSMFQQISDYGDSSDYIKKCQKEIELAEKYAFAVSDYNSGKYSEALEKFKQIDNYADSATYITECQYQQAVLEYNNGDYSKALSLFNPIATYKDSMRYTKLCEYHSPGTKVTLGTYRTPNRQTYDYIKIVKNWKMVWTIIGIDGNKALLLADHGYCIENLQTKKYDVYCMNTNWENSDLRMGLNQDFYNSYFSEAEKKVIIKTNHGSAEDYVFCLSKDEFDQYVVDNNSVLTEAYGDVIVAEGRGTSHWHTSLFGNLTFCDAWWLRTTNSNKASYVWSDDIKEVYYTKISYDAFGEAFDVFARPAIWVDIELLADLS